MSRSSDDKPVAPHALPAPSPGPDDQAETAKSYTFLVRLWAEGLSQPHAPPEWRGTASTIRGQQLGAFTTFAELVALLLRATGRQPDEASSANGPDSAPL